MTLIVAAIGRNSLWLLADRRLSHKNVAVKDDARKIAFVEATDGVAIVGYAGLGATASGTEPADWVSAVLRGRKLSIEQSLGVLADALKKEFPRHLVRAPSPGGTAHNMIIPAFVGSEPRLYSIDLAFSPDRKSYRFRYTRHVTGQSTPPYSRPPRLCIAGSGANLLNRDHAWERALLRLIKASDRGKVSPRTVANYLARLNHQVHLSDAGNTVGPRCIVAWRHRKESVHEGGGAHGCYTGLLQDASSLSLPTISNGMDVHAIIGILMPRALKQLNAVRSSKSAVEMDNEEINAALARLPDKPDERLR